MKEQLKNNVINEYDENLSKIYELEKEIDTVGKARIMSKFCTIALFGAIPAIIMTIIASRLIAMGIFSAPIATVASCIGTTGISLLINSLYKKKFHFKEDFEKYHVKGSEGELAEREYGLIAQKKSLEVKNKALEELSRKLASDDLNFENHGISEETIERNFNEASKKLEEIGRLSFIHDCFLEFEQNKKSKLQSLIYGFICGTVLSGCMLMLPSALAGVEVSAYQTLSGLIMAFTGTMFGSVASYNTGNLERIYRKKCLEINNIELPHNHENNATKIYYLMQTIINDYVKAFIEKECAKLPKKETDQVPREEERIVLTPTKEDIVRLEKKY